MTDSFVSLGRLRPRLRELAGRYRYAVSTLDQMALSVFGFGLNLVLVRALTATDYGIVSLWMSMAMLAIGVQNALVSAPLSVHCRRAPDAPAANGSKRRSPSSTCGDRDDRAGGRRRHVLLSTPNGRRTRRSPRWRSRCSWPPACTASITAASRSAGTTWRCCCGSDGPYLAVTTLCLFAMLAWPQRLASLAVAFFAMAARLPGQPDLSVRGSLDSRGAARSAPAGWMNIAASRARWRGR